MTCQSNITWVWARTRSATLSSCWTQMALTPQRFKDHCLIIVGDGGEADLILAKRRLAAGGRLAHFQTKGPQDEQVKQTIIDDGATSDYFTWQPPKLPLSKFAKKLNGQPRTFWTKTGPDGVELGPGQQLTLTAGVDGKPRHIELVDEEGNVLVQMSGEIVLDIDKETARTLDVEVAFSSGKLREVHGISNLFHDSSGLSRWNWPDLNVIESFMYNDMSSYVVGSCHAEVYNHELQAFGTFSWRHMVPALFLQFLWQIAKYLLSIQLEQAAGSGQVPWFRGFMTIIDITLGGGTFICVEMWSWSMLGMPATMSSYAFANLALGVGMMVGTYFQLSEFLTYCLSIPAIILVMSIQYYMTMEAQPARRLLPHIMWSCAQFWGTTGSHLASFMNDSFMT